MMRDTFKEECMSTEEPWCGRTESGSLRVDGKYVHRLVCDLESTDMTVPTPGQWSAKSIAEALDDPTVWRAYLHLCNTFAERHAVQWCEAILEDGARCPVQPSAEYQGAQKLLDQIQFETVAGLADFVNLLAARAKD
jgi:hypothetical protein